MAIWRRGPYGRTLLRDGHLAGVADTPELAAVIVAALNAADCDESPNMVELATRATADLDQERAHLESTQAALASANARLDQFAALMPQLVRERDAAKASAQHSYEAAAQANRHEEEVAIRMRALHWDRVGFCIRDGETWPCSTERALTGAADVDDQVLVGADERSGGWPS